MPSTTIHAPTHRDGRPCVALFTGPAAWDAALRWAEHLHAMRDVLAARCAKKREADRNRAWRRRRFGDDEELAIEREAVAG